MGYGAVQVKHKEAPVLLQLISKRYDDTCELIALSFSCEGPVLTFFCFDGVWLKVVKVGTRLTTDDGISRCSCCCNSLCLDSEVTSQSRNPILNSKNRHMNKLTLLR